MRTTNWIVGIDIDRSKICYFDKDTQKFGSIPMKIGNADVGFSELLTQEGIARPETADTMAEIIREVFKTYGLEEIPRISFTAEALDRPKVSMLRRVFELLGISIGKSCMQDNKECLFYYLANLSAEHWQKNAVLFSICKDQVRCYKLILSPMTRPMGARVIAGEARTIDAKKDRDTALTEIVESELRNELFSAIFITGDTFAAEEYKETSRALFRHARRVFSEVDIFANGACIAGRERLEERRIQSAVYTGDGLIKCNIGMDIQKGDKVVYYPLITAGRHWFDAKHACELILGDSNTLKFQVSNAENGGKYQTSLQLDGMPERPEGTSRISLQLTYLSEKICEIEVKDLGFGPFFSSCGRVWKETLEEVQ